MTGPPWLDELDLHAGPPEASMGTRALDQSRWLLLDRDWPVQRDEARTLLQTRRDDVVAGDEPALAAALGARLDTWLAANGPHVADSEHLAEADPLAAARARVAEDLCLLVPDGERWVLASGAVCFPSYWRLRDKVGRPLVDVHRPVPGYARNLSDRVDGFLRRLRPGQGVWRRNWSIHDSPDLFVPDHLPSPDGPGRPGPWLRSEYQTLLRLEDSDAVVFTIRTQQVHLSVLAARPDRCGDLVAAVRGWSPAQRSYKGSAVGEDVLAWLDAHAQPTMHRDR